MSLETSTGLWWSGAAESPPPRRRGNPAAPSQLQLHDQERQRALARRSAAKLVAKRSAKLKASQLQEDNLRADKEDELRVGLELRVGPYKILPIFYCNKDKGGRGGNILRNIVGNKRGLGGGYCTIMCNNAPFSVSRKIFF